MTAPASDDSARADRVVSQGSDTDLPSILLVEDSDTDARLFVRALRRCQLPNRVLRAVDGVDALDYLREEWTRDAAPLVVLSDLDMPRMNGMEFVQSLRDTPKLSRLRVFLMTGAFGNAQVEAAYQNGVAGFVSKTALGQNYEALMTLLESYTRIVTLPQTCTARED